MSRRDALKTTLLFSSGLLAGLRPSGLLAADKRLSPPVGGIHVLSFGDFGTKNDKQLQVARSMSRYVKQLDSKPAAVLALGDNFYGHLTPDTMRPRFSGYYPKEEFDCPFYALLGNHDYGPSYDSKQGPAKADMQLDYAAANPASRWKMPAKWYSFEMGPAISPMVKVIYLDGNYFEGALTPQEKIAQRRWLAAEIAKPTRAKWLWVASHYPLFSNSTTDREKERSRLRKEWHDCLHDKRVSLYLAGHDHNLQHLRAEKLGADFIVSGGGGASRYDVVSSKENFSMKTRGFNHLHVTDEKLTVRYINAEGDLIYAFERDRQGRTSILRI